MSLNFSSGCLFVFLCAFYYSHIFRSVEDSHPPTPPHNLTVMVFMDGEGGGIQEIKVTQEPGSLPAHSRVEGGDPRHGWAPRLGWNKVWGKGGEHKKINISIIKAGRPDASIMSLDSPSLGLPSFLTHNWSESSPPNP